MNVTVVICTWNRAASLQVTLQSLVEIEAPPLKWELLVIDNLCTDNTGEVCRQFAANLPLRVVREPQQGHVFSRNRAIAESQGEFLLWTDDDVVVSRRWLCAFGEAFARHPDGDFFGGPIEPDYGNRMPRWLRENRTVCDEVFARRQLGEESRALDLQSLPYGANFATRRAVQKQFLFRSEFGRVATGIRGYDEIDVLSRMHEAGHRGYWVPAAPLRHIIPPGRITTRYIHDYFFGQGQTWAARGRNDLPAGELQRRIRHHRRALWLNRLRNPTTRWFGHLVQLGNLRGRLDWLQKNGAQAIESGR